MAAWEAANQPAAPRGAVEASCSPAAPSNLALSLAERFCSLVEDSAAALQRAREVLAASAAAEAAISRRAACYRCSPPGCARELFPAVVTPSRALPLTLAAMVQTETETEAEAVPPAAALEAAPRAGPEHALRTEEVPLRVADAASQPDALGYVDAAAAPPQSEAVAAPAATAATGPNLCVASTGQQTEAFAPIALQAPIQSAACSPEAPTSSERGVQACAEPCVGAAGGLSPPKEPQCAESERPHGGEPGSDGEEWSGADEAAWPGRRLLWRPGQEGRCTCCGAWAEAQCARHCAASPALSTFAATSSRSSSSDASSVSDGGSDGGVQHWRRGRQPLSAADLSDATFSCLSTPRATGPACTGTSASAALQALKQRRRSGHGFSAADDGLLARPRRVSPNLFPFT
jgi:hypothetical protein